MTFPVNSVNNNYHYRLEFNLTDESTDILERLKKISKEHISDNALLDELKIINPVDLTNVVNCFFMEMLAEEEIKDPVQFLESIAHLIPLEKMQEAAGRDIDDILNEAKGCFEEAKLYFQMTENIFSPGIRGFFISIIDTIVHIIENIISALGIADFLKPAESELHADLKSQKIMMLLTLFSLVSTMLLPLLGAETGALVLGGVLLGLSAISFLWQYIKPMTTHLPANAVNLTKQVRNNGIIAQGRKEALDEIARILEMNRHAILVGPSRIGKSLVAKAFAEAIEKGDYPEFKGKAVFYINTTDVIGQQASFLGGGNNMLNKISNTMGRHRNDIILVFDEIHMACKNNEKIADQFKTFLDEGGEFPHVIGITTDEEYNEHVRENTAFSLRFDRVDIENMSDAETIKILGDTLLKSPTKPLIDEDALLHILDKSKEVEGAPQPSASLKLLKRCINRTEKSVKSHTEIKIIKKTNKILSLRTQAVCGSAKKEALDKITLLEEKIKGLKETLVTEKKELEKLFRTKDLFHSAKKEMYNTILKINSVTEKEPQLKIFLLFKQFLQPSLQSYIKEKSEGLHFNAIINNTLINEVAEN